MKTNLIKLNELRVENDEFVMKSCIINTDKIISVHEGKLTRSGPHLIGTERERILRMIRLESGPTPIGIFVDETVEEVFAMIEKARG